MKKIASLLILIIAIYSQNSIAQSKKIVKIDETATQKVIEMNELIAKTDKTLEMTEEQITYTKKIWISKILEINKIRKDVKDVNILKTKLKEINKEYNNKIYQEVLTKKQEKAYKQALRNNNKN